MVILLYSIFCYNHITFYRNIVAIPCLYLESADRECVQLGHRRILGAAARECVQLGHCRSLGAAAWECYSLFSSISVKNMR